MDTSTPQQTQQQIERHHYSYNPEIDVNLRRISSVRVVRDSAADPRIRIVALVPVSEASSLRNPRNSSIRTTELVEREKDVVDEKATIIIVKQRSRTTIL